MAAPTPSQILGLPSGVSGGSPTPDAILGLNNPPSPAPAPERHGSLFSHLTGDAAGAITGSGVALFHAGSHVVSDVSHGRNPLDPHAQTWQAAKATAKSLAHAEGYEWGPLVRHEIAQSKADYYNWKGQHDKAAPFEAEAKAALATFSGRFHDHPLGYLLDTLTLGSAGIARAAALKTLPEGATGAQVAHAALTGHYQGPLRTITGQAVPGGPAVTLRVLPRNAARAARMQRTDALLKALPADTKVVGEQARVARAGLRGAERVRLAGLAVPELEAYVRARGKLNGHEGAAAQMLAKLPLPTDLRAHIAQLKQAAQTAKTPAERRAALAQAAVLEHPKFQAAYLAPTGKVQAAVETGRALAARREGNLAAGGFPAAHLADAPFRHMRLVRGFNPTAKGTLQGKINQLEGLLAAKHVEERSAAVAPYAAGAVNAKLERLRGELANLPEPPAVDALRAEIDRAGRPQPYYLPDVLDTPGPLRKAVGRATGLTPPAHDVRAWHGTLFQAGLLALRPDVLTPAYLRSVALTAGHELHGWVRDNATVPVAKGAPLPLGHQWLREVRGQQIPAVLTGMEQHLENSGRAFPEIRDAVGEFTTSRADEAALDAKGRRLAVPDAVVKQLRVEQRGPASVGRRIWDESTQVWRALVLNLRIPWLESNVVGNHILAAIRFAGFDGLRAYLGALADVKGIAAARRLLALPATRGRFTDAEIRELLPEQSRAGTFIGSQRPGNVTARLPKPLRVSAKVPGALLSALPKLDRATEGFLRRVGVNTVLRREAKAFARGMPRQTRSLQVAYDAIRDDPNTLELASREVNDALGNFLSLTPTEREGVRGLIPFYAWYREIARIILKLPLDTPGRTALIAKLGQAQKQPALPTYLQGDPLLGLDAQGRQELLALRNMNPFTTPLDAGRAISALWTGNRTAAFQAEGTFNPFLVVIAGTIARAANGDSRAKSVLGAFYRDFLLGLPEARIATNPPSPLYPGRSQPDLAAQFLGDPRRAIDPNVAAASQARGR